MARQATGELRPLADGWAARITIKGRERKDFVLPMCATEPEAQARCNALAEIASRLRKSAHADQIVPTLALGAKARAGAQWDAVVLAVDRMCQGPMRPRGRGEIPTFAAFAKEWTDGDLAKKYPDHVKVKRSAELDAQRFRAHVLPHLDGIRVDEFTLEHAELVMANLSTELAPGTRRQVAQLMSRLMRLAVYPGKWRTSNPIPPGWLPRNSDAKAKECLYPDEDATLLRGTAASPGRAGVPVLRRLAYGFLAREGMRTREMASLRWRHVDLERGRVYLDHDKTDDPRDWDLRPDVIEALARWKGLQPCTEPEDYVFAEDGIPLEVLHLADQLRRDLRRVGITRSQLFERSDVRQPIRAHDLRATFVTISLATGKTETWISDRTGHDTHKMIDAYRRKARTWNLGELGRLDELVPELRDASNTPRLPHAATIQANSQTLNRKCMTSPSRTT